MDVETGGFEGTSLLSAYFGVLDSHFRFEEELSLFLRPKNHIYHVTAEALGVNKINLIEHEKTAITYEEGATRLYNFIQLHSTNGQDKLNPLGHNVFFDINRINNDLLSRNSWLQFVSYRLSDTGVIGNFLKAQGKFPIELSTSLSGYCQYFGIDTSQAHTAKGDCVMTVELYKRMLAL